MLQLARTSEVFCALLADRGRVACWGRAGRLNRGVSPIPKHPLAPPFPVLVEGITPEGMPAGPGSVLTGVQQLDGGLYHMCALLLDRRTVCWGRDRNAQLGRGQAGTNVEFIPGLVMGAGGPLTDIRQLKALWYGTCAIVNNPTLGIDNQVRCWGRDNILGNGSDDPAILPTAMVMGMRMGTTGTAVVTGLSAAEPLQGVAYLTGTDRFACAILAQDQTRYCWGRETVGSPYFSRPVPTTYQGLNPGAVVIANAVVEDYSAPGSPNDRVAECLWLLGGVKCRGDNRTHMLGQGVGGTGNLLNSEGFAGDGDNIYGAPGEPASETLAALPFLRFAGIPE